MNRFLCVIGIVMTLASIAEGQTSAGRKAKKQDDTRNLVVMTYNVHHCNPPSLGEKIDIKAIANVILSQKPDLVALQEIDVNTERSGKGIHQAKALAELTGMYFHFAKAIDHQGGDYGVAVLSRFPITDSMSYRLPVYPDKPEELRAVAAIRVLLPSGRSIVFASTHLGLKEPNRLLQAKTIVESLGSEDSPLILAGDFNAVPDSKVIGYLDQYFSRACQSNCAPTIPVEKPSETIDFIMFKGKKSLGVREVRVIDEKYASDHLPVVAKLVLK